MVYTFIYLEEEEEGDRHNDLEGFNSSDFWLC